jgi:hypothetical protein
VQQLLRKIAMGINDGDAVTELDMLENQVAQQGCFSRARFTDDVGVKTRILRLDDEGDFTTPCGAVANGEGGI